MKKIIAAAAISAALITGCAQTNAAADGAPAGNAPELAGRTFVWQDAPKSQTMPTVVCPVRAVAIAWWAALRSKASASTSRSSA